MIGEGTVLDRTFDTTGACMVLPTERIAVRYGRTSPFAHEEIGASPPP